MLSSKHHHLHGFSLCTPAAAASGALVDVQSLTLLYFTRVLSRDYYRPRPYRGRKERASAVKDIHNHFLSSTDSFSSISLTMKLHKCSLCR